MKWLLTNSRLWCTCDADIVNEEKCQKLAIFFLKGDAGKPAPDIRNGWVPIIAYVFDPEVACVPPFELLRKKSFFLAYK